MGPKGGGSTWAIMNLLPLRASLPLAAPLCLDRSHWLGSHGPMVGGTILVHPADGRDRLTGLKGMADAWLLKFKPS